MHFFPHWIHLKFSCRKCCSFFHIRDDRGPKGTNARRYHKSFAKSVWMTKTGDFIRQLQKKSQSKSDFDSKFLVVASFWSDKINIQWKFLQSWPYG
jgi:hypothetical protein